MNMPIAQRKGVRSYTQYPLSNFVSYNHLSHSLSFAFIPQNVQEAISDPKWREAMHEEMRELYTKLTHGS
jgi:hypothetical protein